MFTIAKPCIILLGQLTSTNGTIKGENLHLSFIRQQYLRVITPAISIGWFLGFGVCSLQAIIAPFGLTVRIKNVGYMSNGDMQDPYVNSMRTCNAHTKRQSKEEE